MKIEQVEADAFGPLKREALEFSPGLTVIHGPNEAGKSSWFAATYAGLCCQRRAKGRGTTTQRRFKDRHKPWHDRGWRVGVAIQLDSGQRLRLSHNLATGDTQLRDLDTDRDIPISALEKDLGYELEYDGTTDGSRLLGLNRDSARATIFVGQADILRVLEDAEELQEFLQRAAASNTFDTTVEQALDWLEEQRRVRVGQPNVGKRPLRAAKLEVERARQAADEARDGYNELQSRIVERHALLAELQTATSQVARLETLASWTGIIELERRLEQADRLHGQLEDADDQPAAADAPLVRQVTETLAAFRQRGPEPAAPEGPTRQELQTQLDALPEQPEGDLEPPEEVTSAQQRVITARAQLETHLRSEPDVAVEIDPSLPPERLREIGTILTSEPPEVNAELEARLTELQQAHAEALQTHQQELDRHAEATANKLRVEADYRSELERYEQERVAYETEMRAYESDVAAHERAATTEPARAGFAAGPTSRTRNTPLVVAGAALVIVGVAAVALSPAVGAAAVIAGLALLAVGLRGSATPPREADPGSGPPATRRPRPVAPRAPIPPAAPSYEDPGPTPNLPQPAPEMAGIEARLESERRAVEEHRQRHEDALQVLAQADLQPDAAALRHLARRVESAEEDRQRRAIWEQRREELEARLDAAARTLCDALQTRGAPTQVPEDGDHVAAALASYGSYVQACRERAEQAKAAARREDLHEALRVRSQREEQHRQDRETWEEHGRSLLRVAAKAGIETADAAGAARHLDAWLEHQEQLRGQAEHLREVRARLEQVLDGSTPDELRAELAELTRQAGPRPDAVPDDVDQQLEEWSRRKAALADRVADLGGKISAMQNRLPSVAEAIEDEAAAERELEEVERLERIMKLTEQHLRAAKERANANIAPALEATIRPWLPRLTGQRYSDVTIDPESLAIQVREPQGGYRDARLLSHGTTEQVYLLLRLALAEHLATTDERAPIVLDDVTVQSDPDRTVALLELLHEVSADRQVILFTQEQEVVHWARTELRDPQDRLVELEVP